MKQKSIGLSQQYVRALQKYLTQGPHAILGSQEAVLGLEPELSGKLYTKLLRGYLKQKENLRQLTHLLLTAQDTNRLKISLEFHNEIDQPLIGTILRLLSLKQGDWRRGRAITNGRGHLKVFSRRSHWGKGTNLGLVGPPASVPLEITWLESRPQTMDLQVVDIVFSQRFQRSRTILTRAVGSEGLMNVETQICINQ